jgi:hypothetical protein
MADHPGSVEVRHIEFGTSYRVGPVELVVDDDGAAFLQIHGRTAPVGPRELRALRVLLDDPTVVALVEGED